MSGRVRRRAVAFVPMTFVTAAAFAPIVALLSRPFSLAAIDWQPVWNTLVFASTGAAVAVVAGAVAGITIGIRDFAGRRLLTASSLVVLAAPPAFWWIGLTRFAMAAIDVPPHDRNIGYVFQDLALWPHLTAVEQVRLVGRSRGLTSRDARALLAVTHSAHEATALAEAIVVLDAGVLRIAERPWDDGEQA